MVQSLDGGTARLVVSSATDGRLLPTGRLAFMRLGTLMTQPFDAARAVTTGEAQAAMANVMQSGLRARVSANNSGAGMFAVSSLGSLAAIRGAVTGPNVRRLIWVARDGRSVTAEPATGAPVGSRLGARIAPDQSRAVVVVVTPTRRELWFVDWTRGVWTMCGDCGHDDASAAGLWSPDGRRLLFGRGDTLVAHTLDGSTPDQVLVREVDRVLGPANWLADGRIVYQSSPDQGTRWEIKLLEPGQSVGGVILPLGVGIEAEVSRDGRWLAYAAQTDRVNVFVQAFPGSGSRMQVSAGSGRNPMWSADGRTLFYLDSATHAPGSDVVAVDIAAVGGRLTAGRPREILRRPERQVCAPRRCVDMSADGQRFLFREEDLTQRASVSRMDLVLNWTSRLATGR
jgi:dipeptidyl aminopeptidase/acylaminoacyl peptidase